ncbi:hypothetical protein EJ06DRAFT_486302 [Trichodelitschia bisporula]|uniref:Coupling of ubiquitin conjugation to ER degradation protein 1 n=1 Tax=Trichodelitschia bisporula TaxID=703511 RepID=A0A6G1IB41_9PEZI|nr:hypothetical protein EJ06DRAFT_486302 [Trichodelitschia bisporula]
MSDQQQSFSLPQLAVLLVIGFLVLRWILWPSDRNAQRPPGWSNTRTRGVNPAHVEQIAQMFPQLSRRDIIWDLQRNGGNVGETTERVLSGRGLEVPPPTFQPPLAAPSPQAASANPSDPKLPAQPDLITRYNLASKLATAPEDAQSDLGQKSGWSHNKEERQRLLQKRREEMILAARRRLEAKG